jgi:hypothetical protein
MITYIASALISYLIMGVLYATWLAVHVVCNPEYWAGIRALPAPPRTKALMILAIVLGMCWCWAKDVVVWPYSWWRLAAP